MWIRIDLLDPCIENDYNKFQSRQEIILITLSPVYTRSGNSSRKIPKFRSARAGKSPAAMGSKRSYVFLDSWRINETEGKLKSIRCIRTGIPSRYIMYLLSVEEIRRIRLARFPTSSLKISTISSLPSPVVDNRSNRRDKSEETNTLIELELGNEPVYVTKCS